LIQEWRITGERRAYGAGGVNEQAIKDFLRQARKCE
tara:strand:+ start:81 stop:188 length:108 start_codon:yes stop_codon:yes gene_type:complete